MESQQTVKLQTIVSTKKKVRHMERKFSGRIAGCIQKIVLLTASAVTAFPFLWMVLSALKTKEEVMDVNVFFFGRSAVAESYGSHFPFSDCALHREQPLCIGCNRGNPACDRGNADVCTCIYALSGKKGFICHYYGHLHAADSGDLHSVLYHSGGSEPFKYIHRADYFKRCQYFWDFSAQTGVYASPGRADRSGEDGWSGTLEDTLENYYANDEILLYHIWTDELYYVLQQLYVAVPYYG